MGYLKFLLTFVIVFYILYQYNIGNIDKSILGTMFWFWLLFEHHINRLINVLDK